VWGDLGSEEALSNLVAGGRVVFHCAAAVGSSAEESYAVNVEGTRRLAAAAARHGCDRFVHLAIAETDGVCLVLNRYNKLISNDGTAVTVQSGMTLRDLYDALAGANLALQFGAPIAAR